MLTDELPQQLCVPPSYCKNWFFLTIAHCFVDRIDGVSSLNGPHFYLNLIAKSNLRFVTSTASFNRYFCD